MSNPTVDIKTVFDNDAQLYKAVRGVSTKNPALVFCWSTCLNKLYISGFKNRSSIPLVYYETHLRYEDNFMKNGKFIKPTSSQLKNVDRYDNQCGN